MGSEDLFHAKISVIPHKFIYSHTSDHTSNLIPAELTTIYEKCILKKHESLISNHYQVSRREFKHHNNKEGKCTRAIGDGAKVATNGLRPCDKVSLSLKRSP